MCLPKHVFGPIVLIYWPILAAYQLIEHTHTHKELNKPKFVVGQ